MTGGGNKADSSALAQIREQINEIDERIQSLINERAKIAQQVGIAKGKTDSASDYYRPEREAEVLRRVLDRNAGPMRDEEMLRLFREIMSACLAQQEPLKIGFLGPEGTFTQTAVHKHFGHSVRALPFHTIDETFQEVECGAADFGVVPIENSTEGSVNNTLDMFLTSPLKIAGEIELKIEQHLMGKQKGLDKIERICAHEQSLAQCRGWIRENLPHVELIGMSSNAAGARRARDEDGTAAIGPEVAADVYELQILVNNIEDRPDNATRWCGRIAQFAATSCSPRRQHDSYRVQALETKEVGLRIFYRCGRACGGTAGRGCACRAREECVAVQSSRSLSQGNWLVGSTDGLQSHALQDL
jgi:chorismate mutase/prephenate dehydratase